MKKIYILLPLFAIAQSLALIISRRISRDNTAKNYAFYRTANMQRPALAGALPAGPPFNSTSNALWVFGDVTSDDAVKRRTVGRHLDAYSSNNSIIHATTNTSLKSGGSIMK